MNRRRNDKSKRTGASGRGSRDPTTSRQLARKVVARNRQHLIIDGYNLMHVTRFKPQNQNDGELRRCRDGLLSLLAEKLPSQQYREITIVFDSRQAPRRLPSRQQFQHLQVLFARDENTADDLIAKLVQNHPHRSQLVVISSDHRVQNAARRKNGTTLDADVWYEALLDYQPPRDLRVADAEEPPPRMDQQELSDFIEEMQRPFADGHTRGFDDDSPAQGKRRKIHKRRKSNESTEGPTIPGTESGDGETEESPFPEGYFDDLEEEFGDEGL